MKSKLLQSVSGFLRPPERQTVIFRNLSGGLNLRQLEYRMDADQSPEMKNLWWHDGLLGCRDGQEYLSDRELGRGIAAWDRLFWGRAVLHIGDGLYAGIPALPMPLQKLCSGLPEIRGTFFAYQEALFYKTKGAFKKITWDGRLRVEDVRPYVPIIQINTAPDGAGDLYQPENRLTSKKIVWFTAARETRGVSFNANGAATVFKFTTQDGEPVASVEQVFVGTTLLDPSEYKLSADKQTVTFSVAPQKDAPVSVLYTVGQRVYHLPEQELDEIWQVVVDGKEVTSCETDPRAGTITFRTAPPVQDPPRNNTIRVTYEKANPEAKKSIDDCTCAAVYGGAGSTVLVLAGSEDQPNAYFWNGSHIRMDPGYFPMSYYNLAGDNLEPVTAFGEQAGFLIVFKSRSVGRCLLGTKLIGDRAYLTLDHTPVNAVLGCDLPGTVRLVDNNLVWCNSDVGVCRLETTTEALENQVFCISRDVNGSQERPGLLQAVQNAKTVCALEDGERYWICADGKAFVWDHGLSPASRPSWFYFTDIPAAAFFRGDTLPGEADRELPFTGSRRIYHLDGKGRITRFARNFRDYGGAIEKVYQFPAQIFGTYERFKDVRKLVLATRSDTDTELTLTYETDYGLRKEPTPIQSRTWHLAPRDLRCRYLGVRRFAHTAVRRPGLRHVRHFSLRLENNQPGCDMSIVSAEITASLQEEER